MLVGFREAVGPVGEIVADRLIVPLKPFSLVRVMVDAPDEPWRKVREDGFEEIAKLGVGGAAWTTNLPTM